ncbi:PTS ascorbate transporter subunit IIC [Clostridium felsineum]|uniref:Ascorbate-specific PTS system EIIC component n=1 Tax=Clostridium felsineum TaxID=36839 RepID=A0A1S8MCD5_9CLOT|nr:PTS ascorbate transporter subunit IIC [Clostridium felsineum]URZ04973.1 Ascorbate-specific PTS system EIIC component [Clostridium felsineum]URZ10014.1 Ascorbate-specific PTS system EIIC component [Clostridium felsineum]
MNVFMQGFTIFSNNILTHPEFFVGLIVLIGYLLLRKPFHETLSGFLKAIVGYMLLNVGAGGLVSTFRPLLAGLNDRFHLNAAVIDPYFGLNAVNEGLKTLNIAVSFTMISLLIGFVWNIVLVLFRKQTKIRTLFVTGHIMVQQATTITWIVFMAFPQFRNTTGAIIIGLLSGTYWAVFSNLTVEATQNLTENAGFAIGHQQMIGVWVADKLAGKLGKPEDSVENKKLPGWLAIFNDNVVATSILMLVFFGIIMVVLGEPYLRKIDKVNFPLTLAFPTYIFSKALSFSVYMVVLMTGVRMFVAELTESFRGISDKLLPGAMPGVDCAATYGFTSPNAVTFGFLCGAIGQFIAVAGLLIFKSPIMIIPGFVPLFFDNATIAVFANKRGGVKAAAILTFAQGVIQVLGGAIAASMFGLYKFGGWHGNIDFDTLWPVMGIAMKYLAIPGIVLCLVFMLVIPHLQYRRHKENYFAHMEEE